MKHSVLFLAIMALSACATYGERVAPVPLPGAQAGHIDIQGAKMAAQAFAGDREANKALGFDIRGAGLLPVRLVIDNQNPGAVSVAPDQTFLIDTEGQAWPLLTAEQAYQRVKSHVELGETAKSTGKPAVLLGTAGALAGAAIGFLKGGSVGEAAAQGAAMGAAAGAIFGGSRRYAELDDQIRRDLLSGELQNERISSGELAYGYLFFPGKDEAGSARTLRLGLQIGDERRVVNLPIQLLTGR